MRIMKYIHVDVMLYLGLGILIHLLIWGQTWYGLSSVAVLMFWPFVALWYLFWWVVAAVIVIVVLAAIADQRNRRSW